MKAWPSFGTLLQLMRLSNLPTVWSNVLAAWLISGGSSWNSLTALLLGSSFLYSGGMVFNDYCDVGFDTRYRPERPIPSGRAASRVVGWIAAAFFGVGLFSLVFAGTYALVFGVILLGLILIYDTWHKGFWWAPIVMGSCRLMLYPIGASSGRTGESLIMLAFGIGLAFYVMGITYLARGERQPDNAGRWALIFLPVPFAISCIHGITLTHVAFLAIALAWYAWILVPFFLKRTAIEQVVAGLLAGIILVDAAYVSGFAGAVAVWLLLLFVLALGLQRTIAAT